MPTRLDDSQFTSAKLEKLVENVGHIKKPAETIEELPIDDAADGEQRFVKALNRSVRFDAVQGKWVELGVPVTEIPKYDTGNFNVSYVYDVSGRITKEIITGDVNRTTTYSYYAIDTVNSGKIQSEVIVENGKTITKAYSYDSSTGKITGVSTTTV